MDQTRRAAIYTRISQDREGAGLGVERQEADCRALADRLGWKIVAVHPDNDLSAYSGKPRPGYLALLADLRAGTADAVSAGTPTGCTAARSSWRSTSPSASPAACRPRPSRPARWTWPPRRAGWSPASSARSPATRSSTWSNASSGARLQAATDGRWAGGRRPYGYEADGVTVDRGRGRRPALGGRAGPGRREPQRDRRRPEPAAAADVDRAAVAADRAAPGPAAPPQRRADAAPRPGRRPGRLAAHPGRRHLAGGGAPCCPTRRRRTNTGVGRRWLLSGIALCGVCGDPVRSTSAGTVHGRPTKPAYTCRTGQARRPRRGRVRPLRRAR